MRFAFKSRDLEALYQIGSSPRYHPSVVSAFFRTMALIAQAQDLRDIRAIKGRRMEQLRGNREGQHSIRLNDQFRLIFTVERDEADNFLLIIEIADYH